MERSISLSNNKELAVFLPPEFPSCWTRGELPKLRSHASPNRWWCSTQTTHPHSQVISAVWVTLSRGTMEILWAS